MILILFGIIAAFWAQFQFREADWNFLRFLRQLTAPAALYYFACVLAPNVPETIDCWRDYFTETRRRYFAGVIAWSLVVTLNNTANGVPLVHPLRIVHATIFVVGLVGSFVESPRVHAFLIALALGGGVARFALVQFRADRLLGV